jgi:chemotaxis protein CheC
LSVLSRAEAAALLERPESHLLVAIRQAFHGEFSGRALLIFPEANSLELVRAVCRGELELEDIIELEQEALAEIGNIILNGCVATVANLLPAQADDVTPGGNPRQSPGFFRGIQVGFR